MKSSIYGTVVPSLSAGAAFPFCGLAGSLEFFFLFLLALFMGNFLRLNYGKRNWLSKVLLRQRVVVCANALMLVVCYNMGVYMAGMALIAWEVASYFAWKHAAADKWLWAQ